ADMAFLVMDFLFNGRPDLARIFSEPYFRASGDEEGQALLPFYTAYRAAVRGKVEGLSFPRRRFPLSNGQQPWPGHGLTGSWRSENWRNQTRSLAWSWWAASLVQVNPRWPERWRSRPGSVSSARTWCARNWPASLIRPRCQPFRRRHLHS